MSKSVPEKLQLENGKYTFYLDGHTLRCDRFGQEWREFLGDKAVYCLFQYALDQAAALQSRDEQIAALREEVKRANTALANINAAHERFLLHGTVPNAFALKSAIAHGNDIALATKGGA